MSQVEDVAATVELPIATPLDVDAPRVVVLPGDGSVPSASPSRVLPSRSDFFLDLPHRLGELKSTFNSAFSRLGDVIGVIVRSFYSAFFFDLVRLLLISCFSDLVVFGARSGSLGRSC